MPYNRASNLSFSGRIWVVGSNTIYHVSPLRTPARPTRPRRWEGARRIEKPDQAYDTPGARLVVPGLEPMGARLDLDEPFSDQTLTRAILFRSMDDHSGSYGLDRSGKRRSS